MKAWATDRFARERREGLIRAASLVVICLILGGSFLIAILMTLGWEDDLPRGFLSSPQPYITGLGILAAIATFVIGQRNARRQSHKQHTIKILFDSRLSGEFRTILDRRRAIWREGALIPAEQFFADLAQNKADIAAARNPGEAQSRQDAAEAVRDILNYYEFICLGILMQDLDEGLLRESLRSIMCDFVADCRDIIRTAQKRNPRYFESLVGVYRRWRRPEHPEL